MRAVSGALGAALPETPRLSPTLAPAKPTRRLSRSQRSHDQLVTALLVWFRQNARDLPWRRTTDPYAIWISEVMLQQTQVQTVLPYWRRWMEELPTIEALAQVGFERVLKLWEGLGYYTRARHLHQAAKSMAQQNQGAFPQAFDAVLALPGIGRYTAGAICSIAFDQPDPILDGNVVRVLTRLYGITGNTRSQPVNKRLWKAAQELVETAAGLRTEHPRPCASLNQALMELGALVCKPKQPECSRCPLQEDCQAKRLGRIDRLPNLGKRTKAVARQFSAFVAWQGERVLVRQRPGGVVNAHLWEFPNIEELNGGVGETERALQCLGWRPRELATLCTVQHSITRFRIRLTAYLVHSPRAATGRTAAGRWLLLEEVEKLALPSAHRQILTALKRSSKIQGE